VSDLRTVIRIKNMATAAATVAGERTPTAPEGDEIGNAYERLRKQAQAVNLAAGWGTNEEFDEELPPLVLEQARASGIVGSATSSARDSNAQVRRGLRGRVLLGQLAAWAAGHQEAFEVEEQMKANAEAKLAAATEAAKQRPGFVS
jgi:hypothetical protein